MNFNSENVKPNNKVPITNRLNPKPIRNKPIRWLILPSLSLFRIREKWNWWVSNCRFQLKEKYFVFSEKQEARIGSVVLWKKSLNPHSGVITKECHEVAKHCLDNSGVVVSINNRLRLRGSRRGRGSMNDLARSLGCAAPDPSAFCTRKLNNYHFFVYF